VFERCLNRWPLSCFANIVSLEMPQMSTHSEGQTYITRYKVEGYPHLAILDPRTGSLLWKKEGWTQVNPLTAEQFVENASGELIN
jgi:hypothetical protein